LEMLADFLTKPLQGNLFRKFRDVLLGYTHVDTLAASLMATVEERVGEERSDYQATEATGAVSTESNGTVRASTPRVTWADVVRRTTVPAKESVASKLSGQDLTKRNSRIDSRSLSRNNPVNRNKV
jgi:hypothetical protein